MGGSRLQDAPCDRSPASYSSKAIHSDPDTASSPVSLLSDFCQGHPGATLASETLLPHAHTLSNTQHSLQMLLPLTPTDTQELLSPFGMLVKGSG